MRPGEIHAFLGANGAGKSTLIKILAGVYQSDRGSVHVCGIALGPSARQKIAFVHQDLGLIDSMSIAENMAIGYGYPTKFGLVKWRAVREKAASALSELGIILPLDLSVSALSGAEKAMVAIGRAIHDNPNLLVLDEPTARLPEADVVHLFEVLKRLSARGTSIIYVSHRLDEVLRLADAATVLRDGRNVACYRPVSVPAGKLVEDILGKVPVARDARMRKADRSVALSVEGLQVGHCGPVSFSAHRGEILGLAGLRGAGHEDVGRAVAGVLCPEAGSVRLNGQAVRPGLTAEAIAAGIGFTTSKRLEEAVACSMTVMENLFLNPGNFGRRSLGFRSRRSDDRLAAEILAPFHVRPADPCSEILSLSGGNQQKVVLARWAGQGRYKLLILEEPTMGVDVGAKSEIYRLLERSADAGMTCLVVSSDIEELVQVCDRVLAFGRGRIAAEIGRNELTIPGLTHAVAVTAEMERLTVDTLEVGADV